jgi:O-antigen ligase
MLLLFFLTLHADQLGWVIAGFNIRFNNLIALMLCAVLTLRFRSQLLIMDKKFASTLFILTLSVILSALFSSYRQRSLVFLGWYGWTLLFYVFLPYFLIKFCDIKKVLALYGLSFVVVGIYAFSQLLLSFFGVQDSFAQQRIFGTIVRPNAFAYEPSFYALYMTPFVMLCNFHFIAVPQENFFFFRRLTIKKVIFVNLLFLVSTSASTVFAYAVFFILLLLFLKERKRVVQFIAACLLAGVGIFAMAPFLIKEFFMKFFFFGFTSHHSFFQRWTSIRNTWNIFVENILLGVGLGGCPTYLYDAWLSGNDKYTFFEQFQDLSKLNVLKNFEPMNVFTEILASLGLVGCVAFCLLILVCFKKARQAWKNAPMLSLNLLIALTVMLVVLQFNQGILRTYVWTHLAMTYALFEKASHAPLPLTADVPS